MYALLSVANVKAREYALSMLTLKVGHPGKVPWTAAKACGPGFVIRMGRLLGIEGRIESLKQLRLMITLLQLARSVCVSLKKMDRYYLGHRDRLYIENTHQRRD